MDDRDEDSFGIEPQRRGYRRQKSSHDPPMSAEPEAERVAGSIRRVLPGGVFGQAHGVTTTQITTTGQLPTPLVTFRVESYDSRGSRTSVVSVRMLGEDAVGYVSDGDPVEVLGASSRGGLEVRQAYNHRTHVMFRGGRRSGGAFTKVLAGVVAILAVSVFSFIAYKVVKGGSFDPPGPLTPEVTIAPVEGPVGAVITVSGTGFKAGERVIITFHSTECGRASADSSGAFSAAKCTVPDSYRPFAGGEFNVMARGAASSAFDSRPFRLNS